MTGADAYSVGNSLRGVLGSMDRLCLMLWERRTGQKQSSLSQDERSDVISSIRAEMADSRRREEEAWRSRYRQGMEQDLAEEMRQARVTSKVRASVPPIFQDARVDALAPDCRGVADKILQGKSGILRGAQGTGKTTLAWACAVSWWEANPDESVAVVNLANVLSAVRAVRDDWVNGIISMYGWQSHLFIDEVGKNRMGDNDFELMFALVNHRYENRRQTILMGNLKDVNEAIYAVGESVFSRLTADGFCGSLSGRDKRRKQ